MKGMKTMGLMMILILSSLMGMILNTENVSAATMIDVGFGESIQNAINQAQSGQDSIYIINVLASYDNQETGTIVINWDNSNTPTSKNLIIQGPVNYEVLNTKSINMNIMSVHFNLPQCSITIKNLEFMAGHSGCTAIYVYDTNSINIENCLTSSSSEEFNNGFYLDGGINEWINDCDVTSFTDYGIRMDAWYNYGTGNKGITDCGINSNNDPYPGDGIYLDDCNGIVIQNNIITNNDNGILIKGSENCYISGTDSYEISDNFDFGILIDDTGITTESEKSRENKFDGLYLVDNGLGGIKLLNNDLDTSASYKNELDDLHIYNDDISENQGTGIEISSSSMVQIYGGETEIDELRLGIHILSSDRVTIDFNCDSISDDPNIHNCDEWGILCENSDRAIIRDTVLKNNGDNVGFHEGNICFYNSLRYEIGGSEGLSSFIGIIEDRVDRSDLYGIRIYDCDHVGDYSSYEGWIKDIEFNMEELDHYVIEFKNSVGLVINNVYNTDSTDIDNCIKIIESSSVEIIDIHFEADSNEIDGICIYIDDSDEVYIESDGTNWIENFDCGLYIIDCDSEESVVIEVQLDNCNTGIYIEDCGTSSSSTYAIVFKDDTSMSTKIYNCNDYGVYMYDYSSLLMRDFNIYQCSGINAIHNERSNNNNFLYIDSYASISMTNNNKYIYVKGNGCIVYDNTGEGFTYDEIDRGDYQDIS
jgi:parallel beta-helix repeat protein